MSKGQTKKTREAAGNRRKLTRAEKKQIAAVIRQAKGDGKAHTAQQTMENMTAALPFMDEDMRPFAERTLQKISPLTENEYAELAIFAADEV